MLKLLEVDWNLWLVILKVALIDSMSEILLHCIVSYCCLLYVLLSWILVTQLLFRAQNVAPKHKRRGGGTLHFLQLLTSPPCGLISFKIGANLISLLNIMPKVFFLLKREWTVFGRSLIVAHIMCYRRPSQYFTLHNTRDFSKVSSRRVGHQSWRFSYKL